MFDLCNSGAIFSERRNGKWNGTLNSRKQSAVTVGASFVCHARAFPVNTVLHLRDPICWTRRGVCERFFLLGQSFANKLTLRATFLSSYCLSPPPVLSLVVCHLSLSGCFMSFDSTDVQHFGYVGPFCVVYCPLKPRCVHFVVVKFSVFFLCGIRSTWPIIHDLEDKQALPFCTFSFSTRLFLATLYLW